MIVPPWNERVLVARIFRPIYRKNLEASACDRQRLHEAPQLPGKHSEPLSLTFSALFEDIYDVRGLLPERLDKLLGTPVWEDGTLSFVYWGADGVNRSLAIVLSPKPLKTEGATAHFEVVLDGRATAHFSVSLMISESKDSGGIQTGRDAGLQRQDLHDAMKRKYTEWLGGNTQIQTNSLLLNRVMDRYGWTG